MKSLEVKAERLTQDYVDELSKDEFKGFIFDKTISSSKRYQLIKSQFQSKQLLIDAEII